MIYSHDLMRKRLLDKAGIQPTRRRLPPLSEMRETEWVPEFEQLMRNRLIMGAFRYETIGEKRAHRTVYNYVENAIQRIEAYIAGGNQEHLIDAANLLMLEFVVPSVDNAHFEAGDDRPFHSKRLS